MVSELLSKYARPVPRYTSYPTAPHFSAAVDAAIYAGWLKAVPADQPLSLYLHVPFCDTLCWFCGCHTKVVNRYRPVAAYLKALLAEVDLVAERLGGKRPVAHIHFGGGSPTILSEEDFGRLMARLRARFAVRADAGIAIEVDPRGLTEDHVAALAAAGVTRVSIGVQDLDPAVQRAINRDQPMAVTEAAVGWFRKHGITAINLDLMYGLPHQTTEGVARTAARIAALKPGRVALFGYAHVPWMKKHQALIDEAALPGDAARAAQADAAAKVFRDAGYVAIGFDHFARAHDALAVALKAGRLRRNFQGYTADDAETLIGLGASAIGALPQGYVQNTAAINEYTKAVTAGALPIARGVALTQEDRLRRAVIERILCDLAVDLDAEAARFGVARGHFRAERPALEALAQDGLIEIGDSGLRVTERGRPFLRVIAAAFDAYLGRGAARHSKAV
jgi:oxygen-independent coproporphyrinogen-3 oxidase